MRDIIAEEATGIIENPHGLGKLFDNKGNEVSVKQARKIIMGGGTIEIPNAGAGSYSEVFKLLGFKNLEVIDWTSSAGDWTFGVEDKSGWRTAYQSNRYPGYGFQYSIAADAFYSGYGTFQDLLDMLPE